MADDYYVASALDASRQTSSDNQQPAWIAWLARGMLGAAVAVVTVAVLLPNTRLEPAVICAEHLRGIVANHLFDLAEPITISLGVTQMKNGEGRDGWIRRVDQALYLAKSSGRNQVRQLT